jgi:hypothetical protein
MRSDSALVLVGQRANDVIGGKRPPPSVLADAPGGIQNLFLYGHGFHPEAKLYTCI